MAGEKFSEKFEVCTGRALSCDLSEQYYAWLYAPCQTDWDAFEKVSVPFD
jgi:hypothetical protein